MAPATPLQRLGLVLVLAGGTIAGFAVVQAMAQVYNTEHPEPSREYVRMVNAARYRAMEHWSYRETGGILPGTPTTYPPPTPQPPLTEDEKLQRDLDNATFGEPIYDPYQSWAPVPFVKRVAQVLSQPGLWGHNAIRNEWFVGASLLALGLFLWFAYDATLGRLIGWIRSGQSTPAP